LVKFWGRTRGTTVLVGNKNGKPLEKDAKPMQAIQNKKQGTLHKIQNIYELTDLLNIIK